MVAAQGARVRRWCVVLGCVAVLVATPPVVAAWPVSAPPDEPVAAVLRGIQDSTGVQHEGYAVANATLGLPELPRLNEVADLFSSTTRLRVWWQAPDAWRIDELTPFGERGTYQAADALLYWDSDERRITIQTVSSLLRLPAGTDLEPGQLGRRLTSEAAAEDVRRIADRRVAGRSAVGLRVRPHDGASSVEHVDVWVDPATHLPLRVEVTGKDGSGPSVVSAYQEITIGSAGDVMLRSAPDASREIVQVPDVAATIDRFSTYVLPQRLAGLQRQQRTNAVRLDAGVGTYGDGLSLLVVAPLPRDLGRAALRALTTPPPEGSLPAVARAGVASTSLVNALVVGSRRDWYALAGTVTVDVLFEAARELLKNPPRRPES